MQAIDSTIVILIYFHFFKLCGLIYSANSIYLNTLVDFNY